MERLKNMNMEEFCKILAYEDCDPAEACLRAGYGGDKHPVLDSYHRLQARRLLDREDVSLRINTLRRQQVEEDRGYQKTLINFLKDVVALDQTRYYNSGNVTLQNGRVVTDFYLHTQVQSWDAKTKKMVNGFDNSGRPKFVDKCWAAERLLAIYQLDGKAKVDIEDIDGLYANAGLTVGKELPKEYYEGDLEDLDGGDLGR